MPTYPGRSNINNTIYLMYFLANVVMKAAHMNVPKIASNPATI